MRIHSGQEMHQKLQLLSLIRIFPTRNDLIQQLQIQQEIVLIVFIDGLHVLEYLITQPDELLGQFGIDYCRSDLVFSGHADPDEELEDSVQFAEFLLVGLRSFFFLSN